MKYKYFDFITTVDTQLEFREEWDDDQWNKAYIEFKHWLKGLHPPYVKHCGPHSLYTEFAKEYYCEATPETHDYWLINNP